MDSFDTVFRDFTLVILLAFIAIVLMLIPFLNPPGKADEDDKRPGDVSVEIRWPDGYHTDVDLWVQAPGDRPVGYSNRSGVVFNLLRDDLGYTSDLTNLNYEFAYSRGMPAGEYVVNLHLYADTGNNAPLPVGVLVSVRRRGMNPTAIFSGNFVLKFVGQEITCVRFVLDGGGSVTDLHDLPKSIRS